MGVRRKTKSRFESLIAWMLALGLLGLLLAGAWTVAVAVGLV